MCPCGANRGCAKASAVGAGISRGDWLGFRAIFRFGASNSGASGALPVTVPSASVDTVPRHTTRHTLTDFFSKLAQICRDAWRVLRRCGCATCWTSVASNSTRAYAALSIELSVGRFPDACPRSAVLGLLPCNVVLRFERCSVSKVFSALADIKAQSSCGSTSAVTIVNNRSSSPRADAIARKVTRSQGCGDASVPSEARIAAKNV